MKPTVHYIRESALHITVGHSALVVPIDHPDSTNVSNTQHIVTSTVISYDAHTGEFETRNTIYVPVQTLT